MTNFFIVSNITPTDIDTRIIRITAFNKYYLPGADNIEPQSYIVKIKVGLEIFDAKYRVWKKRSGVLRIDSEVFKHKLGIEYGDILKITVLEVNKIYAIEKRKIFSMNNE